METRLLILNADPVFEDRSLSILDEIDGIECRVVRRLSEAVSVLLAENFDGFVVEGEPAIALEQATNARQHFPGIRSSEFGSKELAESRIECVVKLGFLYSLINLFDTIVEALRSFC